MIMSLPLFYTTFQIIKFSEESYATEIEPLLRRNNVAKEIMEDILHQVHYKKKSDFQSTYFFNVTVYQIYFKVLPLFNCFVVVRGDKWNISTCAQAEQKIPLWLLRKNWKKTNHGVYLFIVATLPSHTINFQSLLNGNKVDEHSDTPTIQQILICAIHLTNLFRAYIL